MVTACLGHNGDRLILGNDMELMWWHWVALGLGLIALEMFISTFFIMWMGLGALITGLLSFMLPLSFTGQILIWTVASALMVVVWMKYFKSPDRTHAGQAKEGVLGITGLITRPVTDTSEGEILFQRPVLGADRWPVVADAPIAAGERARIVDVLGQTLKVTQL
jgi:membrane protein implicated in regulation of membrane protease activity